MDALHGADLIQRHKAGLLSPYPLPNTQPHLHWPITGLVHEGNSPVVPLTELCPSRTNPSICTYQPLNHMHSEHLPQYQT